jgi:hypothetical protein
LTRTHADLRQKLANVVLAYTMRQQRSGMSRLGAKQQERAALEELSTALVEAKEQLSGEIWVCAYQVAILWTQGLSIKRAMKKLITAFHRSLGKRFLKTNN